MRTPQDWYNFFHKTHLYDPKKDPPFVQTFARLIQEDVLNDILNEVNLFWREEDNLHMQTAYENVRIRLEEIKEGLEP